MKTSTPQNRRRSFCGMISSLPLPADTPPEATIECLLLWKERRRAGSGVVRCGLRARVEDVSVSVGVRRVINEGVGVGGGVEEGHNDES